ncbi:o-succinylbenzoate--CoA ligase [Camelliibacillus cellulosilyticus]|uniref:2-succinylbenzoate--CoA ligase n=1 Tax=Camelliibacillus cellulosilyticus TaxID=2174486 RepID=A0ABV9GPT0_9BACL
METMPHWLAQRARLTPDRIAIETENQVMTFFELDQAVRGMAEALYKRGIRESATVALLQSNSIQMVMSYHALSYLGATVVPLNIRLSSQEHSWQLNDCAADALLFDAHHRHRASEILQGNTVITAIAIDETNEAPPGGGYPLKEEIVLREPHTIIYTSGTTGHPKGVVLTYENHWWSAIGSALNLGLQSNDKWLAVVPLFHVSGLSILMKSVIYGMTVYLMDRFDAAKVNEIIFQRGITHLSVVTTMLTHLIQNMGRGRYPETLRCFLLGGGPVPLSLLETCKDKQVPVYQSYGLSETASQIATLAPEYMAVKTGSAGKPLFPAEIKIVDETGAEVPAGKEGEIVVKGPNVTSGYYGKPHATKQAIQNGWLYTGDIGYLDNEGFLYVLDRRKDMFVSGGENVYPAEIEAVLVRHESIEEAGVIGFPDAEWGKVPIAFVKIREGAKLVEADIQMLCRDFLAGYKVPKRIVPVADLPRNASGKLLRRKLSEKLSKDV